MAEARPRRRRTVHEWRRKSPACCKVTGTPTKLGAERLKREALVRGIAPDLLLGRITFSAMMICTPPSSKTPHVPPSQRSRTVKRARPNAAKSTVGPALFKSEKGNLAFSADKEGRVRIVYSGWDDAKVLLPGEVLEVYWQGGQVLARKVTQSGA